MKLSSSLLEAVIGGVAGLALLPPPDVAKAIPVKTVVRVAIESCEMTEFVSVNVPRLAKSPDEVIWLLRDFNIPSASRPGGRRQST